MGFWIIVGVEVERGMESAMGRDGVVQTGLAGEENGAMAWCSGVCVGALVGRGEVE